MYPSAPPGETIKRDLKQDDRDGLLSMYSDALIVRVAVPPPAAAGCSASGSSPSWPFALVFSFALLALRRRRLAVVTSAVLAVTPAFAADPGEPAVDLADDVAVVTISARCAGGSIVAVCAGVAPTAAAAASTSAMVDPKPTSAATSAAENNDARMSRPLLWPAHDPAALGDARQASQKNGGSPERKTGRRRTDNGNSGRRREPRILETVSVTAPGRRFGAVTYLGSARPGRRRGLRHPVGSRRNRGGGRSRRLNRHPREEEGAPTSFIFSKRRHPGGGWVPPPCSRSARGGGESGSASGRGGVAQVVPLRRTG